jgi:arrestin-related trafficking adapter 1
MPLQLLDRCRRLPSFHTSTPRSFTQTDQHAFASSKTHNTTCALGSEPESADLLRRHNISLGNTKTGGHSSLANLNIVVESPPLVSHGSPDESSGAFFSGQLHIDVSSDATVFETLEVRLFRITTMKKFPSSNHCKKCLGSKEELQKWTFTEKPTAFSAGTYGFIFNYVFSGGFPASTCSSYTMIDYQFIATARTTDGGSITHRHLVQLQRSLRSGDHVQSTMLFPPTDLSASIQFSPVCHINQSLPVSLRLAYVSTVKQKPMTQWKLRKLAWQVEEHQHIMMPNCPKHRNTTPGLHKDVKAICSGQVAWKQKDWRPITNSKGIDAEFDILVAEENGCLVDVQAADVQLNVSHQVIVDLFVVEEFVSTRRSAGFTGKSRSLRMQFPLGISGHDGAGVAWDEEIPPMYQDVLLAPSPPEYHDDWSQTTDIEIEESLAGE